jgi:3-hydroxyacyl-[acyl-carrier-protein] dehydratase
MRESAEPFEKATVRGLTDQGADVIPMGISSTPMYYFGVNHLKGDAGVMCPAPLETIDIQRLFELLPHRPPCLMVDRIVDIDGVNSAVGIKNVTINEPHFAGHFPGRPIMPGVLLIEGIAQTAGAICIQALKAERPAVLYFLTIDQCKFRRPVVPGDVVE